MIIKNIQRKTNSLRKLGGKKAKQTVKLKTATYMICSFSYNYNAKKLTFLQLKKNPQYLYPICLNRNVLFNMIKTVSIMFFETSAVLVCS